MMEENQVIGSASLQNLPGSTSVQNAPDSTSMQNLPGSTLLDYPPGSTSVKNLSGSTSAQILPCSTSMQNLPGSTSMQILPCSTSMQNLPGSTSMQNLPGSTSVQNLPCSTSLQNMSGSTSMPTLPGATSVQNLPGSTSVQNLPGSTSVQNLPTKRKRGRPRKDENLRRVERPAVETPISADAVKRNPRRITSSTFNGEDPLLGKEVSGVLDGSFDAGYLVTVRVGETGTVLRGVLFQPGLVLPISEANDVASKVQVVKRNEIPPDMPSQLHGSVQRVKPRNELIEKHFKPSASKALAPVKQVSEVAPLSPSQAQPCSSVALNGALIDINQVPQASPQALRQAEIRTMSSLHALAGGQVVQPSQSTCSQKTLDTEVLQNTKIVSSTEAAANDRHGIDDLKLQHKPQLLVDTFQVRDHVMENAQEPNQRTDGALKGQAVDLNDSPVNAARDFVAAEPLGEVIIKDKLCEADNNSVAAGSPCVATKLIAESGENHNQSKCDIPSKDETSSNESHQMRS